MSDALPQPPYMDAAVVRLSGVLNGVTDAVPPRRGAGLDEQFESGTQALAEMEALEPHDALETMVAGQAVIAMRNGFACFHEATQSEFASKEATAMRREGLAHQRVMLSALRLLAKAQQRFAPPRPARAAKPVAEETPEEAQRRQQWEFVGPLPPEFSLPFEEETVDADGKIVPPRRYHMPVECLPPITQEVYRNDPSLLYLRENWKDYKGWENMTKEERLKMFGYKHSEYAKKHLMKKPEGESG